MTLVIGSLQLGLIYGLLAIGIYISFRILNIPDMTTEGSFIFGMATMATAMNHNQAYLGLGLALFAGMLAGGVSVLLQTKLKIQPILAGILTMTGLYSTNLAVMSGASNITLLGKKTIYDTFFGGVFGDWIKPSISLGIVAIVIILVTLFFKTNCGLCIRGIGDNEEMARASSMNVDGYKMIGLMLSNSLVALAGALVACDQGYADINSGAGMIVVGLASVILGEAIIKGRFIYQHLIGCVLGSILYRFIIALAFKTRIFPAYSMKLLSAIIVAVALSFPALKSCYQEYQLKKRRYRR